jgi:hypothetical protein
MKKSTIFVDEADAATLRELAAALGFTISRGPGAGEMGNIRALLQHIAAAARQPFGQQLLVTLLTAHPTPTPAAPGGEETRG